MRRCVYVCVCVRVYVMCSIEYATTGVFVDVDVETGSVHIDISIYEGTVW